MAEKVAANEAEWKNLIKTYDDIMNQLRTIHGTVEKIEITESDGPASENLRKTKDGYAKLLLNMEVLIRSASKHLESIGIDIQAADNAGE